MCPKRIGIFRSYPALTLRSDIAKTQSYLGFTPYLPFKFRPSRPTPRCKFETMAWPARVPSLQRRQSLMRKYGFSWGGLPGRALLLSAPSLTGFLSPMDNEDINAIGSLLADLKARTEQLRGYL